MSFLLGALIKKFVTGNENARMMAGMSIVAFGQKAISPIIAALKHILMQSRTFWYCSAIAVNPRA